MSSNLALHELLQMDKFQRWLEQHDDGDIVGLMADPCYCPVASYLRDHGHETIIGTEYIIWVGHLCDIDTPDWVIRFEYHVDDTLDHDNDAITTSRAATCLYIVRSEMLSKACAATVEEYARDLMEG